MVPALPSPLRMLDSIPERYKKGQVKERARICAAASVLEKRSLPIMSAKERRKSMEATPSRKQKIMVSIVIFLICL